MATEQTTEWSAKVEVVYRELSREVWALLYAQCSDPEKAHDALQESFLRLHQQNGTPIHNPRAWLLRVGRNWLRDVARRERVAARPTEHLDGIADLRGDPSSLLADKELQSRVRGCLDRLRLEDREVLVLRYALGWSSNRIANVLNSSAPAIDMRLSRARRRLAEIMEDAGIDHEQL